MHMIQNACNLRYKDAYTSCYLCHAKCKKCTKESYTYATKEPRHTNSRKNWWKYRLAGHVWVHGSKTFFLSLYCLLGNDTSIYVLAFGIEHWVLCNAYGTGAITLKWDMGILVTKVTHGVCNLKELRAITSCATYFASVVDWATLNYLREDQDTKEKPKKWQVTEVDFLSNRHPAKSAFEKPWRAKEEDAEYQWPMLGVCRKNLNMRLTACRCEVLAEAWKQAHRHTEDWMSGLIAVK
jgi:hypothetical protein